VFFEHRLALSATPVRQYDHVGTADLLKFFGDVVFQFTLEQAIGRCLVEYDYYVHPVELSETEMDQWNELTARIRQNAWRSKDGTPDDYLTKLLRDRRAVLETASGKIAELARLLASEDLKGLRHTLIYASDKGPEQLEQVNQLLRRQGLLFHQLTAEETANRQQTRNIIKAFQEGEIQVLTAKRVLDEGVNIPQICRAYILASTTVERQWVQRRGRLLRTCSAIQKTHSVVHDFLALPPDTGQGPDTEARALLKSELVRAQEFARLARNAGRSDGPLSILDQISDAAFR
jgi:superfamily II DNA or RNA helicase